MKMKIGIFLPCVLMFGPLSAGDVDLVRESRSLCAIVVDPEVMKEDRKVNRNDPLPYEIEMGRRRVRDSVVDLAEYMKRITGAVVPVVNEEPPKGTIPVLIGSKAIGRVGEPGKTDIAKQGFRIVVRPEWIGLVGQSPLAVSYAIYELLDRWGIRWYMPSEMGEYVPRTDRLSLPEMDFSCVPSTLYRNIWHAPEEFKRRNRQGGLYLAAAHAFEYYLNKEDREKHPEWKAVIDGKPQMEKLKWTHPEVIATIAERIMAKHEKEQSASYSLSPMDSVGWDEAEDPKHDAGDWDPICSTVSKSDRLVYACNRIAEIVNRKYPEILFGFLAYVDYTRAPVREVLHPNLVPQIAPITYNRQHPMTWEKHPDGDQLKQLVEGWAKKTQWISCYPYAFNLAEVSAPCPFLTKWGTDLPIFFANKCLFWMPETTANFETTMPALYLGMRLPWDINQKPEEIFHDLFRNFYGNAAPAMERYWHIIDDAWIQSEEYSGCGFGYLRIFTPDVMKKAGECLQEAKQACRTILEYRRVELAAESFSLLELFIRIRQDLNQGKLTNLVKDADTWRGAALYLARKYKAQYCFGCNHWSSTWPVVYFDSFFGPAFKEAGTISKKYSILGKPLQEWKYQQDPSATDSDEMKKKPAVRQVLGEKSGWSKPDFDDSQWKTTDAGTDTWSTIGFHHYLGSLWYRSTCKLPDLKKGKKVILWIPSTDGSVKVFVNGTHIPYFDAKGNPADAANGYCSPFTFDITQVVRAGEQNQITILATRSVLNEIGTGGLLAPPMICIEK